MEISPKRKPNRLADYDYSSNGAYFITICTKNKEHLLSQIIVGADTIRPNRIKLSKYGTIAENAINQINMHYENVFVDNYVIMPNHIHILLRIENTGGRMVSAPTVVGSLKRYISTKAGVSLWQKSFYDHIIRDDNDYLVHLQYIENNPAEWLLGEDEYYTED